MSQHSHPHQHPPAEAKLRLNTFWPKALFVLLWVLTLVAVQVYQEFFGQLFEYGILPRHLRALPGILFSPFIHIGFGHLLSNVPPLTLAALGLLVFYEKLALRVIVLVTLVGGLLVWLLGRENYHIGASGVVYGLVSFLFFSGVFRNDRSALAVSILVIFLNQGIVWGFVPVPNMSWESHFFGAVAGLGTAFGYRNKYRGIGTPPEPQQQDEPEHPNRAEPWDYNRHIRLD